MKNLIHSSSLSPVLARSLVLAFWLLLLMAQSMTAVEGRIPITGPVTITASGSYIVTQDFSVASGNAIYVSASNVTIDLDEHTIVSTDTATAMITNGGSASANNIHVRNGKLVGGQNHIYLFSPSAVFSIEDMTLTAIGGTGGIGLSAGGTSGFFARSISVQRNTILGCNGIGLEFNYVEGGRIEENNVSRCTSHGLNLRGAKNSVIRGNSFEGNGGSGIYLQALGASSSNNWISDNTISENTGNGIHLLSAQNTLVDRNSIAMNLSYGILVSTGSDGNSITNNVISENAQDGIRLIGRDCTVYGNLTTANTFNGINLVGAISNDISYNVSQSNLASGILLSTGTAASTYNNIDRNVLAKNGNVADGSECGLKFSNASQDNNIYSNNRTLDNGLTCIGCGICLTGSTNVDGGGNINID